MEKEKFYITTPIYYPSNKMTLGNCYTTIVCDAIARFYKMLGKEVFYLTGTDEHGQKMAKVASEKGMDIKEYLDEIIADTKQLWKMLGIDYNRFIRTTDADHEKAIQKIFTQLYERGYIYKGKYSGLYCTPCESFWTESQLVDGKCPDCGREVAYGEEDAYFFKLSQFGDKLLKLYKDNPEFLQPASRVNEMINNFIKPGLQDLCVSRTSVSWGVPVEFDPSHTIYVWIDALFNYLTALGYKGENEENVEKFWPANLHVVGKEIVRFHAIIWPALLMALDLPLPKQVFAHGWILFGGQKLSKSKTAGTKEVIDPRVLIPRYGADTVRYILLRDIPFGQDGTYSTENYLQRINTDLCNTYGNLVNRTFAMLKKYFGGVVPKADFVGDDDKDLINIVEKARDKAVEYMKTYDVSKALIEIFSIFEKANKYIEVTAPWTLAKENSPRLATVIYNLLECIKIGTTLLAPFLNEKPAKVLNAFGIEKPDFKQIEKFGLLQAGVSINEIDMLYPRLDIQKEISELAQIADK